MSEAKTYFFGNDGSSMMNMLSPLLAQRGLDPNMVFAMMNNRGGQGWENNGMWWIIILFFLLWGRNGWGNNNGEGNCGYNGLAGLINNDKSAEMIMSAVLGNATALSQLATTLNCDVNSIQTAINSLGSQICNVGNQVGLSSQQVINAIQQGNMAVAQQLSSCCCDLKTLVASCCCDVKDSITRGNYENQIATLNQTNQLLNSINSVATGQERGFSQLGYATQQLTCDLSNTINLGIQKILDGQCAAEKREMTAIINKQNEDLSTYKTAGIISQLIGPINAALGALRAELDSVKCKLPETKTISDPTRYIPVEATFNMPFTVGYGYGNCGCGYGFNGFTNAF